MNHDQFGYSSFHYVVKLKSGWLEHPAARGLGELKSEIQIRTMLMHTWSAISHKLLYKHESDVAPQFKRKLNRLSALIELADEQFNAIKNEKSDYQKEISESSQGFNYSVELNSDSLISLRNYYFPNRNIDDDDIPKLVDEIRKCGYSLEDFVKALNQCLPILDEMEKHEAEEDDAFPYWTFGGVVRSILDLTNDKYFHSRKSIFPNIISKSRDKYRSILNS